MLIRRSLALGAMILVVAFAAAPARADESIVVHLPSEVDERPRHVCVVSNVATPGKVQLRSIGENPDDQECPGGRAHRVGSQKVCLRTERREEIDASVREAFEAMAARPAGDVECGSRSGACAATLELAPESDGSFVVCGPNAQPQPGSDRVAVVHVSFGSGRTITNVRVSGSVAVLSVTEPSARARGIPAMATVVGGHYRRASSAPIREGNVVLPLHASCVARDIAIPPPMRTARWHARLRVLGPSSAAVTETCSFRDEPSSARMWLPASASGREHTLMVELHDGSGPQPDAPAAAFAVFSSTWRSAVPPESIELGARRIGFLWRAGCEYPLASDRACPIARIGGGGIACAGTALPLGEDEDRLTCRYTCPGPTRARPSATAEPALAPAPFALPQTIRFQLPGQDDQWDETLSFSRQILSGYTHRDARSVPVVLDWGDAQERVCRLGDRVHHVEVESASGETFTLQPGDPSCPEGSTPAAPMHPFRVRIQGATCGLALSYRIVGDREFSDGKVELTEGRLVIPQTARTAREWYAYVQLGGGFQTPTGSVPGTDGRGAVWRPFFSASAVVRYHPDVAFGPVSMAAELDGTYLLTTLPYHPQHAPIRADAEDVEHVLWNRAWFGLTAVMLFGTVDLALTPAAAVFGAPLLKRDEVHTGGPRASIGSALFLRLRLSRALFGQMGVRVIWDEALYGYVFTAAGDARPTENRAAVFLWELANGRLAL